MTRGETDSPRSRISCLPVARRLGDNGEVLSRQTAVEHRFGSLRHAHASNFRLASGFARLHAPRPTTRFAFASHVGSRVDRRRLRLAVSFGSAHATALSRGDGDSPTIPHPPPRGAFGRAFALVDSGGAERRRGSTGNRARSHKGNGASRGFHEDPRPPPSRTRFFACLPNRERGIAGNTFCRLPLQLRRQFLARSLEREQAESWKIRLPSPIAGFHEEVPGGSATDPMGRPRASSPD